MDDFCFFLCLITVAKNSSTMLNISGESGQPCFVPNLKGKAFNFPLLSMMLPVGFSYMAFIMLRNAPSIPTLLSVLSEMGAVSYQMLHLLI